jgi:mannose-6-phosphate isomerase
MFDRSSPVFPAGWGGSGLRLLEPAVKGYDWGSRSILAEFEGRQQPSDDREAELWFGDHPRGEARVIRDGARVPLSRVLARSPTARRLPYLLKVLAVERPLSMQIHPNEAQARSGHRAENDLGIPSDAPQRNYPDSDPKPELVYALADFRAFVGLRDPDSTNALLSALGVSRLEWLRAGLRHRPTPFREIVRTLLTWPRTGVPALNREIRDAVARLPEDNPWTGPVLGAAMLAEAHPWDPAVAVSLLLNYVRLQPGEAAFVPPGHLHAYLGGTAIELMAPSDNVLRAGLTSKKVDIDEAMRILDPTPLQPRLPARRDSRAHPLDVYSPPDVPFSLVSATANGTDVDLPLPPESIVLATTDCRFVQSDGEARELPRGRAGLWGGGVRSLRLTQGTCVAAMPGSRTPGRAPSPDRSRVAV